MGHDHNHTNVRAGARHASRLWWSLALVVAFLTVQVVTGIVTGSLALLSDAGHMATDALGLAMALAAIVAANRSNQARHRTFGLYRLEILAALANAVLLIGVAAYVLFEAVRRLGDPPEIASTPVLVVGALGLAVNVVAFFLLRAGAEESLNVKGAYFEVLADMLGSVGVIVAAVLMAITGWGWIDPVVGAGIGLFICPRAWRLGREAVRVLVQAAPNGLDVAEIESALVGIDGVESVHDLHVWTLTSEMNVFTAHLAVSGAHDRQRVLDETRAVLSERFGLDHATVQLEAPGDHRCEELTW